MYQVLSVGLGVLIAIMITINSQFARILGNIPSSTVVHIVGLGTVSLVLLLKRDKQSYRGVPYYLWAGGVLGVVLTLLNNICFLSLGASLTIAMGILGQTLAGQIVDVTGFLGMEKHPFRWPKLFGWFLVGLGAFIMTEGTFGQLIYIFLAFFAGTLVMLTAVTNAQLGRRVGLFGATRINYLTGLLTLLILLPVFRIGAEPFTQLPKISPLLIFGGGSLGVIVVTGMNLVLPKIPAVYSTILIFLGQVGTGLTVDYFLLGAFSLQKALGAFVIFLGLVVKSFVDHWTQLKISRVTT